MSAASRRVILQKVSSAAEYAEALRRCKTLEECQALHEQIDRSSLSGHPFPSNLLIKLYSDHGRIDKSRSVFSSLLHRNLYSWTIMLSALAQNGHSREALDLFNSPAFQNPDLLAFTMAFRACSKAGALTDASNLHARLVSSGLSLDLCGQNALIHMFAECGGLTQSADLFHSMVVRNVITWNIILAAHSDAGKFGEVLRLLKLMDLEGYRADTVTFLNILGGCSELEKGKRIHNRAVASGFNSTVMQTAFLHMYARCGSLRDAEDIFLSMQQRDLVSFNAMMGVFAQSGDEPRTLSLYHTLDLEGYTPNSFTYVGVLTACSSLDTGRRIHARVLSSGAGVNYILDNALLNMYSRCGSLPEAERVFEAARGRREVSSWNTMIAAYSLYDRHREAVETFHRMDAEPNSVTFTNVISACSVLRDLTEARKVHSRVLGYVHGYQETVVQNSLVKMYASCGSLEDAESVFETVARKDSATWNSMIAAYVEHGRSLQGLRLLRRMDAEGVKLDLITFLMFTTACAAAGSGCLAESRRLHARITESMSEPGVTIQNALINMYARCGSLESSREVFEEILVKNNASWNAIMAAYAQHGHAAEALEFFHRMELHGEVPCGITMTIVLVACSHAGLQDDAWYHFSNTSEDYKVRLGTVHYHCMIDLLGRVGLLEEAEVFMRSMPYEARAVGWRGFLGACKTHGEGKLGALAAEELVSIEPGDASPYMLLSGI